VEGVIYFSRGTNARSHLFPGEKRRVFIQAFSGLPQKILWKWESARLPGQRANVKIGMWLPQQDILGIMTLHMSSNNQRIIAYRRTEEGTDSC
jgi:hypothetical protein